MSVARTPEALVLDIEFLIALLVALVAGGSHKATVVWWWK